MGKRFFCIAVIVAIAPFGPMANFVQVALSQDPPVVVKTLPRAGDMGVDPSLSEIKVTFSQEMMTKDMWSWVMESKLTFPKITGQIHYLPDNRTCVSPVELKPGKEYVIWINSHEHNAFRNRNNIPAVLYRLRFKTAD